MSRQERYVRVDGARPELARDPQRNIDKGEELLKRHGLLAVPDVVHGQHSMRAYQDQIADLYVKRNADAGRLLSRYGFRELYEEAGELAMLLIDGEVAAWDLLRQDGDTCKVLAGQMVPGYEGYRPGIMLEAWLLERAWRNPFVTWLDWGEGHLEKLLKLK